MKHFSVVVCSMILIFCIGGPASSDVINFDDIGTGNSEQIPGSPDGYKGYFWEYLQVFDGPVYDDVYVVKDSQMQAWYGSWSYPSPQYGACLRDTLNKNILRIRAVDGSKFDFVTGEFRGIMSTAGATKLVFKGYQDATVITHTYTSLPYSSWATVSYADLVDLDKLEISGERTSGVNSMWSVDDIELVSAVNQYVILHRDGALWSTDTGWTLTTPPYYAGTAYARDLEYLDDGDYLILHKDGAIYDSGVGWTMTTPPYYVGTNYAVDMEVTASDADCILHRDGALWYSDTGWVMTCPPYYAGSDYARALELLETDYVILHMYGAIYDSATGWVLTTPPYYAGSAWVVDIKLEAGGYVLLHQDGAVWSSSGGWVMTTPPYYVGTGYARALELVGTDYVILHQDGAIYDSVSGWNMNTPPYYPGSNYAVDLEVQ